LTRVRSGRRCGEKAAAEITQAQTLAGRAGDDEVEPLRLGAPPQLNWQLRMLEHRAQHLADCELGGVGEPLVTVEARDAVPYKPTCLRDRGGPSGKQYEPVS
jgi:hypothetical protein